MKRTKVDLVDRSSLNSKDTAHPFSEIEKIPFCVITPGYACLIGNDEDQVTQFFGAATQFKDTLDELELILCADISVIDIDHTIAVKEQGRPQIQTCTPASSV